MKLRASAVRLHCSPVESSSSVQMLRIRVVHTSSDHTASAIAAGDVGCRRQAASARNLPTARSTDLLEHTSRYSYRGLTMGIANIAGIVRLHGRERPDQVAIVFGDREVTWRELDERSSQLANALVAAGVQAQRPHRPHREERPRLLRAGVRGLEDQRGAGRRELAARPRRDAADHRRRPRQGAVRRRGVRVAPRQDRVGAGHRRAHDPARARPTPPTSRSTRVAASQPDHRPGRRGHAAGHLPAALHVGHHRAAQGRDAQQREPLLVHRRGAEALGLHAGVGVARRDAHVPHRRLGLGPREPGHGLADDPRPRGRPGADPPGGGGAQDHPRDLRARRAPVPADRAERPRPRPVVDAAGGLRRLPHHRAGAARRHGAVLHRQVRAGVRAHRDHRRRRAARRRRPRPGEPARAPPLRRQALPVDRAARRRRRRRGRRAGRHRRDLDQGRPGDGRLLEQPGRDRARHHPRRLVPLRRRRLPRRRRATCSSTTV